MTTARLKANKDLRYSENVNPNESSAELKLFKSPAIAHSEKSGKKSASKNPKLNQAVKDVLSPKKKIRERKFVIVKKKLRNEEEISTANAAAVCEKCQKAIGKSKCLCVAYENLRASQEEFFKNRGNIQDEVFDKINEHDLASEKVESEGKINSTSERPRSGVGALSDINGGKTTDGDKAVVNNDAVLKRSRDRLLEETRRSVLALTPGKVKDLVKEFEKLSMLKQR
ncbi:microtubule-destabilizing protein 60-like [Andrographis paniculata]|uniref:microtubule-destabilizing protein 60-like n=1 Tax=Andrographis paniculata TaxID=175694 RepID=UPI0021E81CFB|nr:microtubule-destabilizing protein 60-like [Andrographis paniculata]